MNTYPVYVLCVNVWHSNNGTGSISEVVLHRAQLVLRRVTFSVGRTTSVGNQSLSPTQPPTLSRTGIEYLPKCVVMFCGCGVTAGTADYILRES